MTEITIPQPKPRRLDWKKTIRRWSWRVPAILFWLWTLVRLSPPIRETGPLWRLYDLDWGVLGLVTLVAIILYLAAKPERQQGCLLTFLLVPYVLLFPVLALAFVTYRLGAATKAGVMVGRRVVQYSQDWRFVLATYSLTGLLVLVIVQYPTRGVFWLSLFLVAVQLSLLFVSLSTWVLRPFAWLYAAIKLSIRFLERYLVTQAHQLPDFQKDPAANKQKLKSIVTNLKNARTVYVKLRDRLEDPDRYQPLLVLGFSRKFFVSVVHAGVLFGLAHFVMNSGLTFPGGSTADSRPSLSVRRGLTTATTA